MIFKKIEVDGRLFKIFDNGTIISQWGRTLKPQDSGRGYKYVHLGRACLGGKRNYYIHRLVACCFLANPCNFPEVNHKDGDRANNDVSNLEWITRLDNIRDYSMKGRGKYPDKKPILQYSLTGEFINEFEGSGIVAKIYECTQELICQAASQSNLNCFTAVGYLWVYKEDKESGNTAKFIKYLVNEHSRLKNKLMAISNYNSMRNAGYGKNQSAVATAFKFNVSKRTIYNWIK